MGAIPTQWASAVPGQNQISTSAFGLKLDLLDHRLGDCDGLLVAYTHCRNTMKAKECIEEANAFRACNRAKAERNRDMTLRCTGASKAFDECMVTHNREPERCAVVLDALYNCSEHMGVFAA